MKRFVLKKNVLITGPNYWGKKSFIEFIPYEKKGWYWETSSGKIIPISREIAKYKFGRIVLCDSNSDDLNIYEHIGVLKFLGIDNVLIRSSRWPPYDGCASLYYRCIKEYLIEDGEVEWEKINKNDNYPTEKRHTCIFEKNNSNSVDLEITIAAGWKPLETQFKTLFVSKDQEYIKDCLEVKAQGYPHFFYYPAFFLKLFGYKIADNLTWKKNFPRHTAADLFLKHRVLDFLGGLSLYYHSSLPSGRALSVFGGHKLDLLAISD